MRAAYRSSGPTGVRLPHAVTSVLALAAVCFGAAAAQAAVVTITFSATILTAGGLTGDLNGPLLGGETVSGTIELDDSVAGVFTPAPNAFVRAEMLYTGNVQSMMLSVDGHALSGSGGDTELFDASGALDGDDSYEVTGVVDTGTVSGVVPASFFWNPAYPITGFSLSSGDPLIAPPAFDAGSFNQFLLTSASGGTAYGMIDSLSVGGAGPVPALPPAAVALVAASFAGGGSWRIRRRPHP